MKIDFHTHGKLAKTLPFSKEYTVNLFQEAKHAGLDALCLTEHFNTMEFKEIYQFIMNHYPVEEECFLVEGIRVFAGMEVDIIEGGHILLIGKVQEILELNDKMEPFKSKENFLTFEELLKFTEPYEMIIGAGHPFREGSHIPELNEKFLQRFDFIDLNGKDYAVEGIENKNKVEVLAKSLKIPVLAGSDTHQSFQYGCLFNRFEKNCSTIQGLKEAIGGEQYKIEIHDYIGFKVKAAGILKKALKQLHILGGDYVNPLI
jgi:histidinol phosphatase-like PHP family hydrolase